MKRKEERGKEKNEKRKKERKKFEYIYIYLSVYPHNASCLSPFSQVPVPRHPDDSETPPPAVEPYAPLELQFVHSDGSGSLVVVSVVFREGPFSKALDQIAKRVPRRIDTDTEADEPIDLGSFFTAEDKDTVTDFSTQYI